MTKPTTDQLEHAPSRASNVGPMTTVADSDSMATYDRLPPRLRNLVANAPYNYAVGELEATLRPVGRSRTRNRLVTTLLRKLTNTITHDIEMHAYAVYGESHPQASTISASTLRRYGLLEIWRASEAWRCPS